MKKGTKYLLGLLIAVLLVVGVFIIVKRVSSSEAKPSENSSNDSSISQPVETDPASGGSSEPKESGLIDVVDAYSIYSMEKEIVYFGKDTCGTCEEFKPLLEEIIEDKGLKVHYFNTNYFRDKSDLSEDDLQKIFDDFGVTSVPVLYEIRNGKLYRVAQISSYYNMGEGAMKNAAEEFLSK